MNGPFGITLVSIVKEANGEPLVAEAKCIDDPHEGRCIFWVRDNRMNTYMDAYAPTKNGRVVPEAADWLLALASTYFNTEVKLIT